MPVTVRATRYDRIVLVAIRPLLKQQVNVPIVAIETILRHFGILLVVSNTSLTKVSVAVAGS